MPQNFLSCEREQVLLMPPSLRDWLSGMGAAQDVFLIER